MREHYVHWTDNSIPGVGRYVNLTTDAHSERNNTSRTNMWLHVVEVQQSVCDLRIDEKNLLAR
jgi:hypothetical protein